MRPLEPFQPLLTGYAHAAQLKAVTNRTAQTIAMHQFMAQGHAQRHQTLRTREGIVRAMRMANVNSPANVVADARRRSRVAAMNRRSNQL